MDKILSEIDFVYYTLLLKTIPSVLCGGEYLLDKLEKQYIYISAWCKRKTNFVEFQKQ